jgi:hypothetical protein
MAHSKCAPSLRSMWPQSTRKLIQPNGANRGATGIDAPNCGEESGGRKAAWSARRKRSQR